VPDLDTGQHAGSGCAGRSQQGRGEPAAHRRRADVAGGLLIALSLAVVVGDGSVTQGVGAAARAAQDDRARHEVGAAGRSASPRSDRSLQLKGLRGGRPPAFDPRPLLGPQCRRALLQPAQAVPRTRHPLREA